MQVVKTKRKSEKTENAEKSKNKIQMNMQAKGITLIALIITIVVLIILATITINFVFGEDGLIARAQQAAEMTEITKILEQMELSKAEVAMENEGKVDPDDFFQKLEDNDIINDKDKDVVDNEDGTYDVTTDEGYEFEVTVKPDGDIDIEYIGKGEGPRITNINIEETTSSVTIEVETKNADDADYTYSYKKNSEGEESWVEVETSKNNTCTINGLEENEIYNIKVKVETSKGSIERIENVQLGEMPKGTITFEDYVWQGDGTANIVVNTTETEYTLQYQKNGTEGVWTDINSGGTITGLKYGDTLYARLWDGTNESDYANVTIEDKLPPQNATIDLSGTTTDTEGSVTATVTLKDNESGVDVTGSKWIVNTTRENIGVEEGKYANNFTTNSEKITIKNTTAGTYYLHVLTKDVAGNKIETVSQAITIEEAKSEVEEAIKDGNTFEEKTEITDEQGNKVTIPEGFKVAEDSGKTVQEGIVIEDVSASPNENVRGSQFVWIPVGQFKKDDGTMSKEIVLGRYSFTTFGLDGNKQEIRLRQAAYTDSNQENYKTEYMLPFYDWMPEYGNTEMVNYHPGTINNSNHLKDLNATAYDLEAWVNSVKENGGYYIGRYEASFAGGNSYTIGTNGYKSASKETNVYNVNDTYSRYNIGVLYNAISQINASKVAINTYYDSGSVKSDLMNSYAWDTAMVYISEAENTDYIYKTFTNSVSNTGKNNDEICKINDMGANLEEWTTERCYNPSDNGNYVCTTRGSNTPSARSYTYAIDMDGLWDNYSQYGFRITLYME